MTPERQIAIAIKVFDRATPVLQDQWFRGTKNTSGGVAAGSGRIEKPRRKRKGER